MAKAKEKKGSDIAKNTILVLLILTIVLSAISTWVVLDALNNVKSGVFATSKGGTTEGQIKVGIVENPANQGMQGTTAGAEVRLGIVTP